MSLIVTTFTREPETQAVMTHWPQGPGEHLAGFEVSWTDVWGSEAVRRRGARFLPTLKDSDLYVEAAELPQFRNECQGLLSDIAALAADVHVNEGSLSQWLRNLLRAVDVAIAQNGGVYIG